MKNLDLRFLYSYFKYPEIRKDARYEYRLKKFSTNIIRFLIVGAVLTLEQLLLGIFKAEPGTLMRTVYYFSSAVEFLFVLSSLYLMKRGVKKVRWYHEIYELSFSLFGMFVAVGRLLLIEEGITSLPVIYIAVLYGVAVIFVFTWWQSIILYLSITLASIILIPFVNPSLNNVGVMSDIITNGLIAWMVVHLNSRRYIGSFLDKKKIEMINIELREKSIRDGLTGLFNRRKLDEVYNEVCMKAIRYKLDFAVIIMDIDHFKKVNDIHGHHLGDAVLIEVAKILEQNIREVDVCGRWGGEEFLVICQETELESAYMLAERLRDTIGRHKFKEDLSITASFGVAAWDEYNSPELLIKTADLRLYKSKQAGRNIVTAGGSLKTASLFD